MDIDIENLFSARDSENTENLQELGRQISEFTKQTKDRKQNQLNMSDSQNRNVVVLLKEVRLK